MTEPAEAVMRHYVAEFLSALDRYYATDLPDGVKRRLWADAAVAVMAREPGKEVQPATSKRERHAMLLERHGVYEDREG
jgi:hypothetical protein